MTSTSTLQDVLQRIQEIVPVPQQSPAATTTQASSTTSFADALSQATVPGLTTGLPAQGLAGSAVSGSAVSGSNADSESAAAAPYADEINAAAARNGVDPLLLQSLIQQESGFNPNATSSSGAQGLTQLMPQTAASLGVTNSYDPAQSIDAGARYLRSDLDRFGGNTSLALAAYNAGAGAVQKYGGVPPYAETQNYVQQVLGRYQRLTTEGSTT